MPLCVVVRPYSKSSIGLAGLATGAQLGQAKSWYKNYQDRHSNQKRIKNFLIKERLMSYYPGYNRKRQEVLDQEFMDRQAKKKKRQHRVHK